MAVTVKRIELWRTEVENEPGILASVLAPLADVGADLEVVMAYRYTGNEDKGAIEVYPVRGDEQEKAAQRAGLSPAPDIPTILIEGENKPGLGRAVAEALAETGINLAFFVTQVIGARYSAVIGFDNESEARAAESVLAKVTATI